MHDSIVYCSSDKGAKSGFSDNSSLHGDKSTLLERYARESTFTTHKHVTDQIQ